MSASGWAVRSPTSGWSANPPPSHKTFALHRLLDEVAHALAIIAPIYVYDGHGKLEPLDQTFLISARFIRGGAGLVEPNGTEQQDLVIQRADLNTAISVLGNTAWAKALRKAHGERARAPEKK